MHFSAFYQLEDCQPLDEKPPPVLSQPFDESSLSGSAKFAKLAFHPAFDLVYFPPSPPLDPKPLAFHPLSECLLSPPFKSISCLRPLDPNAAFPRHPLLAPLPKEDRYSPPPEPDQPALEERATPIEGSPPPNPLLPCQPLPPAEDDKSLIDLQNSWLYWKSFHIALHY